MIYFNFKKNNIKKGFSLIETLVALFIFSISILSVMSVFSNGMSNTNYAKNKMIAGYLSQEGIEYFRNMRDTYSLIDKQAGWSNYIAKITSQTGCDLSFGCFFDNNEDNFVLSNSPITYIKIFPCISNGCPLLTYDSLHGKYDYSYSEGNLSVFSRKIKIILSADNESVNIISEVSWNSGGKSNTVSLSENLTDWIE